MKYIYSPPLPFLYRLILIFRIAFFLGKTLRPGDIVIVQPAALPLSVVAGRKGAQTHLDVRTIPCDIISWKGHLDRYIYWKCMLKWFMGKARSYSFITEALKKSVEDEFGVSFSDYVIWTSAVNTDLFHIMNYAAEAQPDPRIQLFYHGHMAVKRGLPTMIRGFASVVKNVHQDIYLKMVGDGIEYPLIKKAAEDAGVQDHVEFVGLQPYESIPELINRADICICPLPDREEWNVSSPLKVFEYLACGKPIICTPIPAHTDLLKDLPGIIYTDGEDEAAIAQAIMEACRDLDDLKTRAVERREFVVSKYTWKKQAQALHDYLLSSYHLTCLPNVDKQMGWGMNYESGQ
jgi:glycosyltransferase involved in cell wall biosynthesis